MAGGEQRRQLRLEPHPRSSDTARSGRPRLLLAPRDLALRAHLLYGPRFAEWQGNALLGGLSSETLLRLTLKGNRVDAEERIGVQRRIRDVVQAPDGSVWLLSDGKDGELLRLAPASR